MKLYRGLKSKGFSFYSEKDEHYEKEVFLEILNFRENNRNYPNQLDKEIQNIHRTQRFKNQYFTDNKDIAEGYAKGEGGSLIEIDVPTQEILEYFTIEFQNFSKRKKNFELVYIIPSSILQENKERWSFKVTVY